MADHPSSDDEVGPRRRQAARTRGAIIDAAAVEFARSGYHGASLSRILERSSVTKGALYFHFASKEDIALAVLEGMAASYRQVAERARGRPLDPLRKVACLARDVQELFEDGPMVARAGQRLASEGVGGPEWAAFPTTFWDDVFLDLFTCAHTDGLVAPGLDPGEVTGLVTDMSKGAFVNSLAKTGLADLAERVRSNWDLMFRAVATPQWLAGWRTDGGMATVLADYLRPRPAAAVGPALDFEALSDGGSPDG